MNQRRTLCGLAVLAMVLSGLACSGGDGSGSADAGGSATTAGGTAAGGGTTGPGAGPEQSIASDLKRAHGAPAVLHAHSIDTLLLTGQAVELASVLAGTGQLMTSGTLTQVGASYTYAPEPTDRLVVVLLDGRRFELTVSQAQGDFSQGSSGFFAADHQYAVRVVLGDELDINLSSSQSAGTRQIGVQGAWATGGVVYTVNGSISGTTYFQNDSAGSQFNTQTQTTGSITTPGFSTQLNESWTYEMVTSTGSGGGSASAATRSLANVVELAGHTYTWDNVSVQFSYKNGKPSQLVDYWQASGQVLKDGQAFGTYRKDVQPLGQDTGYIKFVLDTPEGAIELESHQAY